jgi:SAM-dependent methyltransferase
MRSIHACIRRYPSVRRAGYWLFRKIRTLFWRYRPQPYDPLSPPPNFIPSVVRHLDAEHPFTLLEVGCNSGATLLALSALFPQGAFTGVDLQRTAIEVGQAEVVRQGNARVQLLCRNLLELTTELDVDYLVSNATLIYLDERQIDTFLTKSARAIRRKLILREPSSVGQTVVKTHIFAHPYATVVSRLGLDAQFDVEISPLPYAPWRMDGYVGADIVLERKGPRPTPSRLVTQ